MRNTLSDLRYSIRVLRGAPGFALAAITCIALGVGANTAIFSVVQGVLLEGLPYRQPERLVALWEHNTVRNLPRNVVGPGNLMRWQDRATSFDDVAVYFSWTAALTGEGEPERLPMAATTANFFDVIGVEAELGRVFEARDIAADAEDVAVISQDFWQTKLGGDPDVIGRVLSLNDDPTTVVGVVSSDVQLPAEMDVWLPFRLTQRHRDARGRWVSVVARLKPGVAVEEAQAEMATIARQLETETPDFNSGWSVQVIGLHDDLVRDVRRPILVLMGAVGFVLLIACANVANLMLAHGTRRRRELAIRAALGAGRGAIIRQVLTESVVLAAIGGGLGLLLAVWSVDLLVRAARDTLPGLARVDVDPGVLLFTGGISVVTGLLFGVAPALRAVRTDLNDTLKSGARSVFGDPAGSWARDGLIVAQVALSLVLLIGAGLLLNSFRKLIGVDPGFATERVLSVDIDLIDSRYPEDVQQARYFTDAIDRLESLPDIDRAAAISFLPIGSSGAATSYYVNDRPEPEAGRRPVADVRAVTPGFFAAMDIPLLRGRGFTLQDREDSRAVVIVNRAVAETQWPDQDPIGKSLTMWWGEPERVAEVVGVVEDVRLTRLDTNARSTLYWPQAQFPYDFMTVMARYTSQAPPTAAVRAQLRQIDADQPITAMRTMSDVVARSLARERLTVALLGTFSVLALLLAAVGIYGVVSYTTGQRTQEIGVRMALGARGRDVLRQVLGQGLRLATAGAVVGVVAAIALTRWLRGLLFEISPTDPATIGVVVLLLMAAMVAACWIPARRATRVDPVTALRQD